jgi:hypothetical protein
VKIDIEIPDITQQAVIEAMAARLLADTYEHDDSDPDNPDPTPRFNWDRKRIGHHLRTYFEAKVAELADQAVRRVFDEAIRDRIYAAIDAVLAEGWQETNGYGESTGAKLDLKGRIGKLLTETRGDSYNRQKSVLGEHTEKAVESIVAKEFQPVIDAAKAHLKTCLDEKVMKTVSATIANAVGLR